MDKTQILILLAALLVLYFVYKLIKGRKDREKAENGEDMQRLKDAVAQVVPDPGNYRVVCAHWERTEHMGRTTTTYYYSYALAFDAQQLWIVPLRFEKDEIFPQDPILVTRENLGIVKVSTSMKKEQLQQVSCTLSNKKGESPINFYVDAINTRENRFHHFNIAQQAECEQFERFISSLAGVVNEENRDLQQELAAKALASDRKSSRTLGILSILFAIIPLVGLIFGGIGLLGAPKPKETGGKPAAGFVLCLIGVILSIALPVAEFLIIGL